MVGAEHSFIVDVDPEGFMDRCACGVEPSPVLDHYVRAIVTEWPRWRGKHQRAIRVCSGLEEYLDVAGLQGERHVHAGLMFPG